MKYGLDNLDLEGNQVGCFTFSDNDEWNEDATKAMTLWEAYRFMQGKERDGDPITDNILETLEAIFAQPVKELQAYAIDIDNAEKQLGWVGIPMSEKKSVAQGISELYRRMTREPLPPEDEPPSEVST